MKTSAGAHCLSLIFYSMKDGWILRYKDGLQKHFLLILTHMLPQRVDDMRAETDPRVYHPLLQFQYSTVCALVMLGDSGAAWSGRSASWVCGQGTRRFSSGGLVCPRRVIKMEVCFNKDARGHFLPTDFTRVRLFQRYV